MSQKESLWSLYFKSNLLLRILIGLVLGAVCGIIFGEKIMWVKPFGDVFVRLLKMIVLPVVITSLIVGSASIHPSRIGKIGVKVLIIYLITSGFAVAIGLFFGNLLHPGSSVDLATVGQGVVKKASAPSLVDTILNIIPKNPFAAIAKGQILPTIFFSMLMGIGLAFLRGSEDSRIRNSAETVFNFFDGAAEIIYRIVKWILEYAPIGVFALIAIVFAKQGAKAFGPLGAVTLTVYLALLVHLILVYGGLLRVTGISPIKFFSKAKEAIITAFVTRSSSGTLPVTMNVAKNQLGVSKGVYSFTLPLGATINMDGTAIYQGVCVMFVAFATGMNLTLSQQLTVIVTAVLASIGTAGVPGAGAIMLLMVLNSVGLDLSASSPVSLAYAMILGVDALLDMGRTALNVAGDLTCTTVVAKFEKEVDFSILEK
ncbi:dicarboxylate/amino acid:cation symporter [Deferribacter abyssi]|uniref:dicarboxylate/amino acid:cation symporter n=1 Tax=Deferribacter abyssi TaxID=213806 RepID=UPI003C2A396F